MREMRARDLSAIARLPEWTMVWSTIV